MDLFQNLTDDQVALLGCAGALLSTGALMCVSYFFGPAYDSDKSTRLESAADTTAATPAAADGASTRRNAA